METPLRQWIGANEPRVRVSDSIDPVASSSSEGSSSDSAAQYSDSDRSIFARSAIRAGHELIALQRGAFLSGSSWLSSLEAASDDDAAESSNEAVQALCRELRELQLSPTVQLVMALLYECARKDKSRFAGYLEQLPTRIPLPMTWSSEARRMLKHTAAFPSIDDELVANMFKSFGAPLASKFSSLWSADGEELTLERFQWAYAVVSSRAFTISGAKEPTLLPVIDMANHNHESPAAKIVQGDGGSFQLVALRDIAKNEAVTISYGDLSNAELLCRYGFVLPDAVPTDCIMVTSSELLTTYSAFLNDDADKSSSSDSDAEAADREDKHQPAAKKRKLFQEKKAAPSADDALFFLLHGDQQREFGLADALLSFVFAKSLPAEVLYDVLAVLLGKRDKVYSGVLEKEAASDVDEREREAAALVQLLTKHERNVCRRILLGIMTLEENSSDEADFDEDDDSGESS